MKPSLLLPFVCGAVLPLFTVATSVRAQVPGAQDTSFATGPNSNGPLHAIALQADGEVVVGGAFSTFRGESRNCVARLNPSGNLEPFNPGLALGGYNGNSPSVLALGVQGNGQIIVGGQFTVLNQTAGGGVARLNSDGSLDSSFNAGSGVVDDGGVVGEAEAVAVQANGQILVGGAFLSFNGLAQAGIVRLNADGSLDRTFNPGGAGVAANDYGGDVKTIVIEPDGKVVIGGSFSAYNGVAAGCVARLNADGTLDTTFNVGTGADVGVTALAVQSNGQILAGGGFNDFDGVDTEHLVRLNTDGSLDTSYDFDPDGEIGLFVSSIDAILVQPDGTVLIGGDFLNAGGLVNSPTQGIYRLLADGTPDTTFNGSNAVGAGVALALQSDGKALVASNTDSSLVGATTGDGLRVYDLFLAPTATVVQGVKKVYESGSKGPLTFIVTLSSAPTAKKIVVKYVLKGAAESGVDYETPNFKVKFKPGVTTKTVSIYPIDRGIEDYSVAPVKLVLTAGNGYVVGSPNVAKDKIVRNH